MSLAHRSVTSVTWNVAASLIAVGVLFVRSVLLARLVPVYVFGIYALAGSIVGLTVIVPNFGMGGAFLHRAPETADEQQAACVHFTLKLMFTVVWASLLVLGAFLFTSGETRTALLLLTATTAGIELAQTPRLILTRRVVHRRLALMQILKVVLTTLVAVGLAWRGEALWALLAANVVSLALTIVALYVWRPVWRPRMVWSPAVMRYFLRFGSRNFPAVALMRALDRIDDLWTGLFLGKTPLGYYSRAYTFATYPRKVLAAPVNMVAGGTYAELKGDRKRLSRAFFRTNAFMVRSGFFLAGLLALIAPEFIGLLLGAKWLPMLDAFRLMLVYTMLDPMKITVGNLFIAVGKPGHVARARAVQLAVLVGGLFLLGLPLGITGVALAADGMLVVGMAILLWQALRCCCLVAGEWRGLGYDVDQECSVLCLLLRRLSCP
jgi:O-antigen/teichoic acid export membrane protein